MNAITPTRGQQRRNKGFEATHAVLIDVAVRLISEKGADSLSIAELSRAAGVNRTTVYYHFKDRDDLIAAVRAWSAEQLAKAFAPIASQRERGHYITRFVIENPELIRLWIEDFLSPGDIRVRYPEWDRLVEGIGVELAKNPDTRDIDPEIYCTMMLTTSMIGPRIYHASVRPDLDREEAISRFAAEQARALSRDGLMRDDE